VNDLGVILGVAAVALVIVVGIQVLLIGRKVSAVPPDGNIYEALRAIDTDLAAVEAAIEDLRPRLGTVEARLPGALCYSAVVTYDAYGNIAGNLSRSVALLNERRDGLVLTILVSRSDSTFYTKMVRAGRGSEALSPEEEEAVRRAVEI
jgi:hypothetical protein